MLICLQVHRATLRDGTEVVVKVQRPGLEASPLPWNVF
jgi:predicted unusual protein kinase regulating ubiquinone biosynthesis (AarF/ABC1/UbiB family)